MYVDHTAVILFEGQELTTFLLNAWIMIQALGWNHLDTRVIHLDGDYRSPIDDLHRNLLSPVRNEWFNW